MFNSSAWTRMGVNGCGCIGCHSPDRPSLTPARGSTTRATYCFRRTGAKGYGSRSTSAAVRMGSGHAPQRQRIASACGKITSGYRGNDCVPIGDAHELFHA